MNADEKAVAEFRRPCRYNHLFDDEGPCCCSACDLHEFALKVAARIRAEASGEVAALAKLLRHVVSCGNGLNRECDTCGTLNSDINRFIDAALKGDA